MRAKAELRTTPGPRPMLVRRTTCLAHLKGHRAHPKGHRAHPKGNRAHLKGHLDDPDLASLPDRRPRHSSGVFSFLPPVPELVARLSLRNQ